MRPIYARLIKNTLASSVGATVSAFRSPPKRFIIFTNGRTGSNWLVSLLRSHPEIRVHSEIFGEHQISDTDIRKLISRVGPVQYLESCFRRMLTENYVGLKMLYYQIEEDFGIGRGVTGLSTLSKAIFEDPDLYFIHLKRLNHVDRLLSNARAKASGQFLNGAYSDEKIIIDIDWAHAELGRMVQWESKFDELLPADRTFNTSYEEMIEDASSVATSVFEFLNCKQVAAVSQLKKQKGSSLKGSIGNYDAFKDSLKNTQFFDMTD